MDTENLPCQEATACQRFSNKVTHFKKHCPRRKGITANEFSTFLSRWLRSLSKLWLQSFCFLHPNSFLLHRQRDFCRDVCIEIWRDCHFLPYFILGTITLAILHLLLVSLLQKGNLDNNFELHLILLIRIGIIKFALKIRTYFPTQWLQ